MKFEIFIEIDKSMRVVMINCEFSLPRLSHKCPIPISPLRLTSHFMCAQFFHMVSIDVPAGVGAPPLNTTSNHQVPINVYECRLSMALLIYLKQPQQSPFYSFISSLP